MHKPSKILTERKISIVNEEKMLKYTQIKEARKQQTGTGRKHSELVKKSLL